MTILFYLSTWLSATVSTISGDKSDVILILRDVSEEDESTVGVAVRTWFTQSGNLFTREDALNASHPTSVAHL